VVVVGAGSSGAAYAARAAETPGRRVLLLEAGPVFGAGAAPGVLLDGTRMAAARPGGRYADAHPARLAGGAERTIVRGRVGGGSGALNGGVFLRARPEDFAAFAAGGRDAWSYRSVLPVLAALEDDRDFTGPGHGRGGPVPVRRPDPLLPATEAFIDACRSAGHPEEPDKNAAGPPGVGRLPLNVVGGVRHSTALTHLAPAAGRPGLEVRGRTPVLRVELDRDGRAAGVLARPDGGAPEPVRARTVVLCAGALRTPQLLMLSGIGPPAVLRGLGAPVRAEAPGVGAGVQDHAMVMLGARGAPPRPPGTEVAQAALHLPDLEIMPYTAPFAELIGPGAGPPDQTGWGVTLLRPRSRGALVPLSADPADPPRAEHRHLIDGHDRARLRAGVLHCAELMAAAGLEPADPPPRGTAALDRWIAERASTAVHLSGGCAMGDVTDQWGRVEGVPGLRVADASLLPRVPSRGLNATAVLIGELLGRHAPEDSR